MIPALHWEEEEDRDNNKAMYRHGQSHPIPGPGSQVLVAPP